MESWECLEPVKVTLYGKAYPQDKIRGWESTTTHSVSAIQSTYPIYIIYNWIQINSWPLWNHGITHPPLQKIQPNVKQSIRNTQTPSTQLSRRWVAKLFCVPPLFMILKGFQNFRLRGLQHCRLGAQIRVQTRLQSLVISCVFNFLCRVNEVGENEWRSCSFVALMVSQRPEETNNQKYTASNLFLHFLDCQTGFQRNEIETTHKRNGGFRVFH